MILITGCGESVVNEKNIKERNGYYFNINSGKIFTGTIQSLHKNGKVFSEIECKKGLRNGLYKCWYFTGEILSKTEYKNGKIIGLDKYWYKNGQKREYYQYKDGKEDGFFKSWYENGQKK